MADDALREHVLYVLRGGGAHAQRSPHGGEPLTGRWRFLASHHFRTWFAQGVPRSLLHPTSHDRGAAMSMLETPLEELIQHIAARWDIEVLFADTKELLGLDQYQQMSAKAIRRFWTLAMVAYCFLDEERVRLQREQHRHEKRAG